MPLISYVKTIWLNNNPPSINDVNLNKLEQGIYDVTEETISQGTRLTTAEGNITSIDGRLTTAEGEIDTAQADIISIDGRLTTAESDIDTAQADIISIDGRLTTAESDIVALETGKLETITSPDSSLTINVTDPLNPTAIVNISKFIGRITANTDFYIDYASGSDSGAGTVGDPWKTLEYAIDFLDRYLINSDVTVTIHLTAETVTIAATIVLAHPCGNNIKIIGDSQSTTILSSTGITIFDIRTAIGSIEALTVDSGGTIGITMTNSVANLSIRTGNCTHSISAINSTIYLNSCQLGYSGNGNTNGILSSTSKIYINNSNFDYNNSNGLRVNSCILVFTGTNRLRFNSSNGISSYANQIYITGDFGANSNSGIGLSLYNTRCNVDVATFTTSTNTGNGTICNFGSILSFTSNCTVASSNNLSGFVSVRSSKIVFDTGSLSVQNNTNFGFYASYDSHIRVSDITKTVSGNGANYSPATTTADDPTFANQGSWILN